MPRHSSLLGPHPVVQILDKGAGQPVPGVEPAGDVQLADLALDVDDGVDLLHGFQRDRRYVVRGLLLAGILLDVCKLEELPSGMAPAQGTQHGTRITITTIKIVVAAIGIGLENTLPSGKMPVRMGHLPVAREVEQRGWWCRAGKGPVVADIGPEPRCLCPSLRKEGDRCVVAVEALGRQNMVPDQGVDRCKSCGAGPTWSARVERPRSTPSFA